MNKLTAKEILEIIEKNYSESSFAYNEWTELSEDSELQLTEEEEELCVKAGNDKQAFWESIESKLPKTNRTEDPLYKQYSEMLTRYGMQEKLILQKLGLGEVEEVDQYGGSGKGDTWYSVKHFKDHDVYIRIDGYYSSYNGTDFEEGYGREVKPKEKVITVFN